MRKYFYRFINFEEFINFVINKKDGEVINLYWIQRGNYYAIA